MKAKTIDRLELTRRKSKFLQESQKMRQENNIQTDDNEEKCPVCGAKLLHVAGCLECPNKCFSKCG